MVAGVGGAVHGRGAAGDVVLVVVMLKVLGGRSGADLQRVRYGTVRPAQGDEFEDLKFAAGQVGPLAAS
jgi:hypothetical protein